MEIPGSFADLTPAWLSKTLGCAVRDLDVTIIGEQFGFTGVIARLRPIYVDGSDAGPPSLIAKLPTADRTLASSYREQAGTDLAARLQMAERSAHELWCYEQIAPAWPLPAPRMYAGAADLDAGKVFLLLEDIAPAQQGDVLRGCTIEQAGDIVHAIAHVHGYWWRHPRLASFDWLPNVISDPDERQARFGQRAGQFLDRHGARIDRRIRDLIESLRTNYAAVLRTLSAAPPTLIHADLHLDNVLFHPEHTERPVTILDWQTVARGGGAIDLALLVVDSLTVETRRACELDLLREYHAILVAHGVDDYAVDQLLHDYRLALLRLLAGIVGWLGRIDIASLVGRERQLVEAVLDEGRTFQALLDQAPHVS